MASLQANAHSLQQAQEKQAASQAWLQDEMESSLKSALGRLLEVQEHAVNLHKTIQDVLEPLSHITAIAGVFNRFWILGSFIVGAAFLATVISRLNRSLAMIMLVTICECRGVQFLASTNKYYRFVTSHQVHATNHYRFRLSKI